MIGEMMKRILIVALAIFAIGVSGCAVSTGSDDVAEDAAVEMPEGDVSNPFAIEPTDEAEDGISDDVVVEDVDEGDDDVIVEEEEDVQVELLTDAGDVDTITELGEDYSQLFQVVDYGAEYEWDVDGLPAGTGLAIEKYNGSGSKAQLKGNLNFEDVGTHQVTVTVWDAADPSNEDSMSFTFVVEANEDSVVIDLPPDPCDKPLTIEVVKVGNYIDNEVLGAGDFTFDIGSKVKVEVKAMRGDLAPKGVVTWGYASEVEDSRHCHFLSDDYDIDGIHLPTDYNYSWVMGEMCIGGNGLPYQAVESKDVEIRKTTNPFWVKDSGPAAAATIFGSSNTTLKLEGRLLYDGPLPVRNMPLDTNPIERLTITAKDQCDVSEDMRDSTASKKLKFGIVYPNTVDSDGGDMTDMKAYLDYNEVNQYYNGGSSHFSVECNVEEKYDAVCAYSHFAVVFTDSDGLSDYALDKASSWELEPALRESEGWVHYDFKECDSSHDNCDEKGIKNGDVKSSVLDATRVYLLWVAPTKLSGSDKYYADFNIKSITFRNRYWDAKFRDEDDDFNNNITKNFTRLDRLWQFDGMSEKAYRYSDSSNKTKIFRRRELAGYVPDLQ
jgi:hypothetical protein